MKNIYAITDIHGCYKELLQLLSKLNITKDTTLIFMGDYVDRGPDSKAVLDKIIDLQSVCNVIVLKGNHEVMMKSGFTKETDHYVLNWLHWGGKQTLASYDIELYDFLEDSFQLPDSVVKHIEFIDSLEFYYETDTHIFVHASPEMVTPIADQPEAHLIWRRPQKEDADFDYNHSSGKTIISGHTPQKSGEPLKLSEKNYLIDTGCYSTGILTAYDVNNDSFITN